jgi:hypothetical protein
MPVDKLGKFSEENYEKCLVVLLDFIEVDQPAL